MRKRERERDGEREERERKRERERWREGRLTKESISDSTTHKNAQFVGDDVNLYDKTTKELFPIREASNRGAVIEKFVSVSLSLSLFL